jgi:hypothetical protein
MHVVSFLLALVRPFYKWYHKYKKLTQKPPKIELKMIDRIVTRTLGDLGRWQYADIFIRASAHLRSPLFVQVEYSLDLIRTAGVLPTTLVNDITKWHIIERKCFEKLGMGAKTFFYQDIQPLDTSLSSMKISEGWLHFRADKLSDSEISKFQIRLCAVSANGMVCTEKEVFGCIVRPWEIFKKID